MSSSVQTRMVRQVALFLLLLLLVAASRLHAQTLTLNPAVILPDQPTLIRVIGLQGGEHATLQAALTDGNGADWHAEAEFVADAQGSIDVSTTAPVSGSYRGISAMGLVWSMRSENREVHSYQAPHELASQLIHIVLRIGGKDLAQAELTQLGAANGVRQVRLEGVIHGILLLPPTPGLHPGLLVLGGSEGGLPLRKAAWLASHGYAALALAYFHYETLPNDLQRIPLEYFGQALLYLRSRPEVKHEQLGIVGTSRGGEAALQLASMYPDVHAVVAFVPANKRYPGCCGWPAFPAWTFHGASLAYTTSRESESMAFDDHAIIPIEQAHGPILMISGDNDDVWPSNAMANAAMLRLRQARFPYAFAHLNYPRAGHRAGAPAIAPTWSEGLTSEAGGRPFRLGGTPEGNAASTLDAAPKILAFLQDAFAAQSSR